MTNVGAGLLAKGVNDNAYILNERAALRFFASKLAPTPLPYPPLYLSALLN